MRARFLGILAVSCALFAISAPAPAAGQNAGDKAGAAAEKAGPVTAKNWRNHPQIVEIRKIYKEVRAGIDTKRFKRGWATYESCEPGYDLERTIYRDSNAGRYYFSRGGAEGFMFSRHFYYDREGKLRFVFVIAAAPNGTITEFRNYFDAAGNRLWIARKRVSGPGYAYKADGPQDVIVTVPDKALYEDHPCTPSGGG